MRVVAAFIAALFMSCGVGYPNSAYGSLQEDGGNDTTDPTACTLSASCPAGLVCCGSQCCNESATCCVNANNQAYCGGSTLTGEACTSSFGP